MTTTEHHYDYLISVLGRIREVTGVGHKPMLSELPEAIAQVMADLKTQPAPQPVGRSDQRRIIVTGPVSSGKTVVVFAIQTMLRERFGAVSMIEGDMTGCVEDAPKDWEKDMVKQKGWHITEVVARPTPLESQPKAPASDLERAHNTGYAAGYSEGVDAKPKAPASAVECAREIGPLGFSEADMYSARKAVALCSGTMGLKPQQDIAALFAAHTNTAVAEARVKALEEAACEVEKFNAIPPGTLVSVNGPEGLPIAIRALKGKEGV